MQAARNIAIIAVLALIVSFVPGGDAAAVTIQTALQMGFLAAITWAVLRLHASQELTLSTMTESRRAVVYGSAGLIVFLIAGYDQFRSWGGGGVLIWISLMGAAVAAIFLAWREANSYDY